MSAIKVSLLSICALIVITIVLFFYSTSFVGRLNISYPEKTDFIHPSKMLVRYETFVASTILRPAYAGFVRSMNLTGNERILDFGSGAGGEALFLAKAIQGKKGTLTCLDISPAWLEVVKYRLAEYQKVFYMQGDITRLDIPAGSFDVIVVRLVLHDINRDQRKAVIAAFGKILATGGTVHILEPLGTGHGIDENEMRSLFKEALFKERFFQKNFSFVMFPPRTMGRAIYCGK